MKGWLGIDTWANPEALLLLALIPAYLFWYLRYYARQRLVIRLSYDPSEMHKPELSLTGLRMLPRILQLVAIALLILAIARPQRAGVATRMQAPGASIVLVLDVSGSMEMDDFVPNRLEAAKSMAAAFVAERPNDQIGVVLFAAEALSYVPLTTDHDYLIRQLRAVNFTLLPRQGTVLGTAAAVAINQLRDVEGSSRVIILLSDGGTNRGQMDPVAAARLARDYQIRLYCIGLGQPAAEAGEAPLDETLLRRMAAAAGGRFYHASHTGNLERILREISAQETQPVEASQFRRVEDRYPLFVELAIVLLGISFALMLTFLYNPLEQ
ncbi:MAG: VWA domain-containing protein [Bacteroidia bacterium]